MAHYRYQVKTATGQLQSGTISADSVMAAANTLRGQGLRVVQIVAADTRSARGKGGGLRSLNYASGPSARDVLDFTTQLAVMIRAGISIRAALEGISEQVTNVKWRTILRTIRQDVESGKQFSEAISKYPKLFSPLYVNMVRASEMSGSFAKMLDRIAAYMTQQLETRRMVIGAMIYPGVIGMMAVSVTVFLLTFVLPRFAVVFEGKEDRLPRPTIMLLALSDFMVNQWYLILGACAIVGVGFFLFLRTSFGRVWFDKMKLVAPLFKRMFRALYISRSLHTMAASPSTWAMTTDSSTSISSSRAIASIRRIRKQTGACWIQARCTSRASTPAAAGNGCRSSTIRKAPSTKTQDSTIKPRC